jgi:hypothetical protein
MFDLLDAAGVSYVVIGAQAVRAYLPTRQSDDLDLLVAAGDVDRVVALAEGSFEHDHSRGQLVSVLHDRRTGVEVHVRAAHDKCDQEALASGVAIELHSRTVRIPPPENLVVMKLASMRGQRKHWEDVIALLQADCIDVRFVVAHLAREHPGLIDLFLELVVEATPPSRRS